MNNKSVAVLGSDGYIGTALTLRLLKRGYKVYGVDDFRRRRNVLEMNSFSAIKINNRKEKIKLIKKFGDFNFLEASVESDFDKIYNFINSKNLVSVVNLAQQPSAPFSHISRLHNIETTIGNLIGTINILYAIKDISSNPQLIQIGSMGEYKPDSEIEIPEGNFDLEIDGRILKNCIFPRSPGSYYHTSKVASTYYIDAACRFWSNITATDIQQGVVYGCWTPEIEEYGINTRFDTDEAFGTLVHRFIIQAILRIPLTIYGNGEHKRGFISLNDCIQCLELAIENIPENGYRVWNQLDVSYSMNDIADIVVDIGKKFGLNVKKSHIASPRSENTNNFVYKPKVNKLKKLGFIPTRTIEQEIEYVFNLLAPMENELYPLKDVVIPKILWKK